MGTLIVYSQAAKVPNPCWKLSLPLGLSSSTEELADRSHVCSTVSISFLHGLSSRLRRSARTKILLSSILPLLKTFHEPVSCSSLYLYISSLVSNNGRFHEASVLEAHCLHAWMTTQFLENLERGILVPSNNHPRVQLSQFYVTLAFGKGRV